MREMLRDTRKGAGYTQQSFSERIGISRSHYAQVETGDKDPSLRLALKIKEALDHDGDDIFFNPKRPD